MLTTYRHALTASPGSGEALRYLARALHGDFPEAAVRWLRRSLACGNGASSWEVEDVELLAARTSLVVTAEALRLGLYGRPERGDLINMLARVFEILVRSGLIEQTDDRPSADDGPGLFREGVTNVGAGRLDRADSLFRASLAIEPESYACRAALAIVVLIVTQMEHLHLVLSEGGAVDVRRHGGILSIVPKNQRIRGRILFAYYADAILLPAAHPIFAAHTNRWESRCIARTLLGLGYSIDAIELGAAPPDSVAAYDTVFCLHDFLARVGDRLPRNARKIMLLTGSSPDYQNRREMQRISALAGRRGRTCAPRRQIANADRELQALVIANHCLLQGGANTLGTYDQSLHAKTIQIPVSGAIDTRTLPFRHELPATRHVLWHFGPGAIHKGLDVAVEVFLRNPSWTLEVVSQACEEPDFLAIYGELIRAAGNIRLHGFQFPSSRRFREIADRCVAILGTSCSEGISPACITGLQYELVPILTKDCGLDLDGTFGVMIEDVSIEGIEQSIEHVMHLPASELARQGRLARQYAETMFSRDAFSTALSDLFRVIMGAVAEEV